MSSDDLSKLAASLTDAQRRAVLKAREPEGRGKWPLRNALIDKGLTTKWPFMWALTPLGLALRAYLERNPDD